MEVLFVRKAFMQTPISEYIRQLRRQRGMTQAELGGEHFSKSYVSAVEREKIVPSYEALRFFAEQLDQSVDYLRQIAEQTVYIPQSTTQLVSSLPHENDSEPDRITPRLLFTGDISTSPGNVAAPSSSKAGPVLPDERINLTRTGKA
jgi:transcriptional regulator with XRE-family HTH domain